MPGRGHGLQRFCSHAATCVRPWVLGAILFMLCLTNPVRGVRRGTQGLVKALASDSPILDLQSNGDPVR